MFFTRDDLATAANLLSQFGEEFELQYGPNNVVMNVHLVAHHLVPCCAKFGPLWAFWCYPFENMLGAAKKFVHGTRKPEMSFLFGLRITRMMPRMEAKEITNINRGNKPSKKQQEVSTIKMYCFVIIIYCYLPF